MPTLASVVNKACQTGDSDCPKDRNCGMNLGIYLFLKVCFCIFGLFSATENFYFMTF